jgi:hypothetical protein
MWKIQVRRAGQDLEGPLRKPLVYTPYFDPFDRLQAAILGPELQEELFLGSNANPTYLLALKLKEAPQRGRKEWSRWVLHLIALVNKGEVVLSLRCHKKAVQVGAYKVVLGNMFVNDNPLHGKDPSCPLWISLVSSLE